MSTHAQANVMYALDTLFARKGEAAPTTARVLFGTAPPASYAKERFQRSKDTPPGRESGALAFLIQRANKPAPPPPPMDLDWSDTGPMPEDAPQPTTPSRETARVDAPHGKSKRHKMTVRLSEVDYLRCRDLSESLGMTLQKILETGITAHLDKLSSAAETR